MVSSVRCSEIRQNFSNSVQRSTLDCRFWYLGRFGQKYIAPESTLLCLKTNQKDLVLCQKINIKNVDIFEKQAPLKAYIGKLPLQTVLLQEYLVKFPPLDCPFNSVSLKAPPLNCPSKSVYWKAPPLDCHFKSVSWKSPPLDCPFKSVSWKAPPFIVP